MATTAAKRYAEALADLTQELTAEERAQIREQLESLTEAARASTDLTHVLANPSVSPTERTSVLEALVKQMNAHDLTRRFLMLLADRGRLGELDEVVAAYAKLDDARMGVTEGKLTTAVELPEAEVSKIREALEQRMGKQVQLTVTVDPAVLGGIRTEVGSMVFDGTLRSELDRLRERLEQTS